MTQTRNSVMIFLLLVSNLTFSVSIVIFHFVAQIYFKFIKILSSNKVKLHNTKVNIKFNGWGIAKKRPFLHNQISLPQLQNNTKRIKLVQHSMFWDENGEKAKEYEEYQIRQSQYSGKRKAELNWTVERLI